MAQPHSLFICPPLMPVSDVYTFIPSCPFFATLLCTYQQCWDDLPFLSSLVLFFCLFCFFLFFLNDYYYYYYSPHPMTLLFCHWLHCSSLLVLLLISFFFCLLLLYFFSLLFCPIVFQIIIIIISCSIWVSRDFHCRSSDSKSITIIIIIIISFSSSS